MPRTKEIQVYTLAELQGKAKERALEKLREWATQHDWWDYTYEDAKEIGKRLGLEIDDISFSGFWSQGDGASFTGSYTPVRNALTALHEHAQNDAELDYIAGELDAIVAKKGTAFSASITRLRTSYARSGTMQVELFDNEDESADAETEKELTKLFRDLANWIYKTLEAEYDYLTSEPALLEDAEANKYEFDVNGRLV